MAAIERQVEVVDKLLTPRQVLLQLSRDEFELALSPEELNNPVEEVVATHWLNAVKRSGVWRDKRDVYFDQLYPRDREVFDGNDKKINEGSGKLFYQTQANIWAELAYNGLVNPRAAEFVVAVFRELQKDNRSNIKYLVNEWVNSQELTQDEKDSIGSNISRGAQIIHEASLAVKQFFRSEFDQFTAKSVDPVAVKLEKITDNRADFINGSGIVMIPLMHTLLKKIPSPSVSA